MSEPLHIQIKVDATGRGSTIVDGMDLSNHIAGLVVESDVHSGTQVQLRFVNVEVEIDGTVDLTAMGNEWATYRLGKIIRDEIAEGVKA